MKALSYLFVIIFAPIIFPYKWIRQFQFAAEKAKAIKQCNELSLKWNKQAYVVQNGREFYVGLRSEFRQTNSKIRKQLAGYLDFDYRNAIIYKAK